MAKIFISFFNGVYDEQDQTKMPCFYESFIKGLMNEGNDILLFHHKNFFGLPGKIHQSIEDKIKKFEPDLVILFNNNFYDISETVECPIVIYEVDSPKYYSCKEVIKRKPDRFFYFVAQDKSIEVLKSDFLVKKERILYVPFFSEIKANNIEIFTNEISFIGSKFTTLASGNSPLGSYFQENINNPHILNNIETIKNIISLIKKDSFISKKDLITKYLLDKEIVNQIDLEQMIMFLSDENRIKTLSSIADLGLTIYGTTNWGTDIPNNSSLSLCYNPEKIYSLKQNQNIYNSSKLSVNINHLQAVSGFSWRVCDIMASNSCLVSEYKKDIKILFPNAKIPTFSNEFEAREICKKLLANENMRKDIVQSCQEIINKSFRFRNLLNTISEYLSLQLHSTNNKKGSLEIFLIENKRVDFLKSLFIGSNESFELNITKNETKVEVNHKVKYLKLKLLAVIAMLIMVQLPFCKKIIEKKFNSKNLFERFSAYYNLINKG